MIRNRYRTPYRRSSDGRRGRRLVCPVCSEWVIEPGPDGPRFRGGVAWTVEVVTGLRDGRLGDRAVAKVICRCGNPCHLDISYMYR